jgi:hypothetical protein
MALYLDTDKNNHIDYSQFIPGLHKVSRTQLIAIVHVVLFEILVLLIIFLRLMSIFPFFILRAHFHTIHCRSHHRVGFSMCLYRHQLL